ncbi:GNAT family N-acetyltransferase [Parachitinimonas caeni]|uniref:GNAT family N-acetyltransferase n=1 Tax=Parachitinimonas caeni TaxID=3031301 RepID=A0ABT7DW97_9NEIS|nr:GNAT family N-acetyltransferase [Parachitinimonas caeni]MDK2124336.1 GNAT family N-acetyltransferase [Parachitinimonas caeni]
MSTKPMTISFREADLAADCERIAAWQNDARTRPFVTNMRGPDQPDLHVDTLRQRFTGFTDWICRLLVCIDEVPIGFAFARKDPPMLVSKEGGVAWLAYCIGEHAYRGRGLSRQILRELEARALAAGCHRAEVGVFEFNLISLGLIRAAGYQEIARHPEFTWYQDRMWADIRFTRNLTESVPQ